MTSRPMAWHRRWIAMVAWGILIGLLGSPPVSAQEPPATPPQTPPAAQTAGEEAEEATDTTNYWARDLTLREVDSQTVISRLRSLGIEIPFEVEGDVTLEATVWIPFGNLLTPSKYRLDATLTSPRLSIESVQLADAMIQFQIDEGILHLRDLQATLLNAVTSERAGELAGTGAAQLVPLEGLELNLRLQDLDLQTVNRDIVQLDVEPQGTASGSVTLTHPEITATDDLKRWTVLGEVEVERFALESQRRWDLQVESLNVRDGVLRAEGLVAKQLLEGTDEVAGVMRGAATVQLVPAGPVTLNAQLDEIDLRHAAESLGLDVPLVGIATGTVQLENPSLQQLDDETAWAGLAQLAVAGLAIDSERLWDVQVESLSVRNGRVRADGLVAKQRLPEAADAAGLVRGTATMQLEPAGPLALDVRLEELRLPHAADSLGLDVRVVGVANGTVQLENPNWHELEDVAAWSGTGQLAVAGFALDSDRLWDVQAETLRLRNGGLRVEGLVAQQQLPEAMGIAGVLRGAGNVQLEPAGPLALDARLEELDLPHAADSLGLDVRVVGVANGTVQLENPNWHELEDVAAWTGTGQLAVAGFAFDSDRLWDVQVEALRLRNGGLGVEGLVAQQQLPEATGVAGVLRGAGNVQLEPAGPLALDARLEELELQHATDSFDLDVPLVGIASGAVRLEHPNVDDLDKVAAWNASAEVAVSGLRLGGLPSEDQQLDIRFGALSLRNGQLALGETTASLRLDATGEVLARAGGSASAAVSPVGPVQVDVTFQDVSLGPVASELDVLEESLAGTAAGQLQARHPRFDQVTDWSEWTGTGQLVLRRFQVGDRPPITVDVPRLALEPQRVAVSRSTVHGEGWQASAEGAYAWSAPRSFQAAVTTGGIPTAALYAWLTGQAAPDETAGVVAMEMEASGQGDPLAWQATGTISVPQGKLAGLRLDSIHHRLSVDSQQFVLAPVEPRNTTAAAPAEAVDASSLRLGRAEANYELTDQAFRLDRLYAELLGGRIDGSATVGLGETNATEPVQHRAALQWQDLAYAGPLPFADSDIRIRGTSSGTVQWSVPANRLGDPRAHRFEADVNLASLAVAGEALGNLSLQVASDDQVWQASLNGALLGGRTDSQLTIDISSVPAWQQFDRAVVQGNVDLNSADVSRLFAFWQTRENAQKWRGEADLEWSFQGLSAPSGNVAAQPERADAPPAGAEVVGAPGPQPAFRSNGVIRFSGLVFAGRQLTDRLLLRFGFDGETVAVNQLVGSFAGGRLGASGNWRLAGPASGVDILLTGVDASRALLVVSPSLAEEISGIVSGSVLLAGARDLRVSGRLDARDLQIRSIRLGNVRSGVDGALDLASQQWRLRFRNIAGSVARGRFRGHASVQSSPGQASRFDLDSSWELDNVDFEEMIAEFAVGASAPARGELSGRLTLEGRRVASVNDLKGTLDGRLGGTEATAVPGLPAARNQLGVLSLRNTTFSSGEIHGRFRRGTFSLTELWLVSDQLRVWADGKVSLTTSRCDIDAVVATGNFEQANVPLLAIARQVSLDATLPVGVIMRVNEALSDRVVFLRLTGPISRPVVRIRAGQTLGQNAARFFLRSLTDQVSPVATPRSSR